MSAFAFSGCTIRQLNVKLGVWIEGLKLEVNTIETRIAIEGRKSMKLRIKWIKTNRDAQAVQNN